MRIFSRNNRGIQFFLEQSVSLVLWQIRFTCFMAHRCGAICPVDFITGKMVGLTANEASAQRCSAFVLFIGNRRLSYVFVHRLCSNQENSQSFACAMY